MRILGGQTVQVYRFTRDGYGDRAETLIGELPHCFLDTSEHRPDGEFAESSTTRPTLGCPRHADIQVEARDRLAINGRRFQVVGDRDLETTHPATGHDYGHYAATVESVQ